MQIKNQVSLTLSEIQGSEYSRDRKYTLDPFIKILEYLLENNVYEVPDFIKLLTDIGLKSKEVVNCIQKFVDEYNSQHINNKIKLYKRRSFRQLKYHHKDYVIGYLVLGYRKDLLKYLRSFVSNIFPNENEIDQFINKMSEKFDEFTKENSNLIHSEEPYSIENINFDEDDYNCFIDEVNENEIDYFDDFQIFNY